MAYTTPTAPTTAAGGHLNSQGDVLLPWQALVDEIELRPGDTILDGVVSGMACTENGTTVTIATGRAYVAGKRYSGSTSINMTGQAADTYYGIIDSSDDDSPYVAQTAAPSSGELWLFTLVWDGTSITSLDSTVMRKGIVRHVERVSWDATVTTGSRAVIPVLEDLWIEGVSLIAIDNGTGTQATTAEVYLGPEGAIGTTVFTTPSRRPSIWSTAANYTAADSGEPDGDRSPDAGEVLTVGFGTTDGASQVSIVLNMRLR